MELEKRVSQLEIKTNALEIENNHLKEGILGLTGIIKDLAGHVFQVATDGIDSDLKILKAVSQAISERK